MRKFVQTDVAGDQYFRAREIVMHNPKGQERTATFYMESVTNLVNGEDLFTEHAQLAVKAPTTPEESAEEVTLFDIEGNNVGKMSRGEMYQKILVYLNSEMIHTIRKQEKKEAEELERQKEEEARIQAEREAWEAEYLKDLEEQQRAIQEELARLEEERKHLEGEETGEDSE